MKIAISTDWHFGNAGNSTTHNQDLLDFVEWMGDICDDNGIDYFVHGGDLFHSRDKLDVQTIEYAMKGVGLLNHWFKTVKLIKGNHDLYFRDNRDVCSLNMFKNVVDEVVDFYTIIDNVMLVSWLCTEEEYDEIINVSKKNKIEYIIGHFEFNNFFVNDRYEMEHGHTHKQLKHIKKVFSGHYHGRQEMDNIVYVGNPFPYDMNDANDPNKGFCIFDTETGKHEFIDYDKVSVISITPEELFDTDWSDFDLEDVTLRVVVKDDIPDETLDRIKTILEENEFRGTKLVYKPTKQDESIQEATDIGHLMSVDEAVLSHIEQMSDSENINKDMFNRT